MPKDKFDSLLKELLPDLTETQVLAIIGAFSGIWVLWQYLRSSRVKTAEFLQSMEKEYSLHISTLSKIEDESGYKEFLQPAVRKLLTYPPLPLTVEEKCRIEQMDAAFRFFFLSLTIKRLGIGNRYLELLNAYYLHRCVSYEELGMYIRIYWPRVYFWAKVAGRPLLTRLYQGLLDLPERFELYIFGAVDRERRGLVPGAIPPSKLFVLYLDSLNRCILHGRGRFYEHLNYRRNEYLEKTSNLFSFRSDRDNAVKFDGLEEHLY